MFYNIRVYNDHEREIVRSSIEKTNNILIRGKIHYYRHTDANGQRKHSGSIIADSIVKLLRDERSDKAVADNPSFDQ